MTTPLRRLLADLDRAFTSLNDVPVERIHITAKAWKTMRPMLAQAALEAPLRRLVDRCVGHVGDGDVLSCMICDEQWPTDTEPLHAKSCPVPAAQAAVEAPAPAPATREQIVEAVRRGLAKTPGTSAVSLIADEVCALTLQPAPEAVGVAEQVAALRAVLASRGIDADAALRHLVASPSPAVSAISEEDVMDVLYADEPGRWLGRDETRASARKILARLRSAPAREGA